ncbi:Actin-related protein 8 [Portunus trituberculatus]|uniref:Actin-related protein 8 n=1 Tax=Portunus trituberculatus TaxID=210409 RepID=A0A5B7I4N0_PORTR|nr:Actin-related protein 8 [Portunus trituberculatus]
MVASNAIVLSPLVSVNNIQLHFESVPGFLRRQALALAAPGVFKSLSACDHVAATFGAGLGYACVVDVGDQKTSVSCVEDAISHPATRVCM